MSNAAAALQFLFRILGTTDEVTTCEHCGRVDLKGTIILGVLDEDGNIVDRTYFGAVCGARAAGWTVKDFRAAARDADKARREEERAAREAEKRRRWSEIEALRGTADCPSGPTICRKTRPDCVRHGRAA